MQIEHILSLRNNNLKLSCNESYLRYLNYFDPYLSLYLSYWVLQYTTVSNELK